MPWQIAGIVVVLGAIATASQGMWTMTGALTMIGGGLLLFAITR